MEIPDLPSNNKFVPNPAKKEPKEKPNLQVVGAGTATLQKKPLGQRLKGMFFDGDFKSSAKQVFHEVLVPEAKSMILDGIAQTLERAFFGESRPRSRSAGSRVNGILGGIINNHTNYNGISSRRIDDRPPLGGSRSKSRSSSDVMDVILPSRELADEVLDKLHEVLNEFQLVTVADLYQIIGENFHYIDENWGWTHLEGSRVRRLSNDGYLVVLPPSESLRQR